MAESDTDAVRSPLNRAFDILLGTMIMGTVGVLIGLLLVDEAVPIAAVVGAVLGTVVGVLGGRRFLISILVGTILGGALAWLVAGAENISFGAGTGAAMGGFLGVQISMLLDLRAARKREAAALAERKTES